MVKKLLLLIILVSGSFLAFSQHTSDPHGTLLQGALLVRLQDKEAQIAALRQLGKPEKAMRLKEEQARLNKSIIAGFRKGFKLSPVYFFYQDYSQAVKDRNLGAVVFLNDSLQPDSAITVAAKQFLIAEITTLEQDPVMPLTRFERTNNLAFYDGSHTTFDALVLKDAQFVQFPASDLIFVRTFDSISFLSRDPEIMARLLSRRIVRRSKHHLGPVIG